MWLVMVIFGKSIISIGKTQNFHIGTPLVNTTDLCLSVDCSIQENHRKDQKTSFHGIFVTWGKYTLFER